MLQLAAKTCFGSIRLNLVRNLTIFYFSKVIRWFLVDILVVESKSMLVIIRSDCQCIERICNTPISLRNVALKCFTLATIMSVWTNLFESFHKFLLVIAFFDTLYRGQSFTTISLLYADVYWLGLSWYFIGTLRSIREGIWRMRDSREINYLLNSSWSLNLIRRKKCRIKRNYRKFGDSGLTCEFLETNLLEISLKWRWMFTIREDFLDSFRVSCKCKVDGRAQTERYKRNWCHQTSSVMWHSDRFYFVCSVNARKTPNCCH